MRIFEIKTCGTVVLEHPFVRGNEFKISGTTVKVSIFLVRDESEALIETDPGYLFESDLAMIMREDATYNATTKKYQYTLNLSDSPWQLGVYLIRWEGTVDSSTSVEFDKLYVVSATRDEIAKLLEMPSSISAGGVTLDYSSRLTDMSRQRGVRVGRLTKQRYPVSGDSERDYDRSGNKYRE